MLCTQPYQELIKDFCISQCGLLKGTPGTETWRQKCGPAFNSTSGFKLKVPVCDSFYHLLPFSPQHSFCLSSVPPFLSWLTSTRPQAVCLTVEKSTLLLLKNLTHRFPPHCFGTGLAAKQPKKNKTWTPHLIAIVVVVGGWVGGEAGKLAKHAADGIHFSRPWQDHAKYESVLRYMSTAGEGQWTSSGQSKQMDAGGFLPPLPLINCLNVPPTFLKTGRSKLEGPCHWDDLQVIATLKAQVTSVFLLLERLLGHSHEKRMGKHVQQFPREIRWMITSHRGAWWTLLHIAPVQDCQLLKKQENKPESGKTFRKGKATDWVVKHPQLPSNKWIMGQWFARRSPNLPQDWESVSIYKVSWWWMKPG